MQNDVEVTRRLIERAEAALENAELKEGINSLFVAARLEALAKILRDANIRLAEATELEVRAKIIREAKTELEVSVEEQAKRDEDPEILIQEREIERLISLAEELQNSDVCSEEVKALRTEAAARRAKMSQTDGSGRNSMMDLNSRLRMSQNRDSRAVGLQLDLTDKNHATKKEFSINWVRSVFGAVVVSIIVVSAYLSSMFRASYETGEDTANYNGKNQSSITVGSNAIINKTTFFGITERDYDEFINSVRIKDRFGAQAMRSAGSAGLIEEGTPVLVIGRGGFLSATLLQVRITDGPNLGRACFVAAETVSLLSDLSGVQGESSN